MVAWPHKGKGALKGEENPFAPWPSALSIAGITPESRAWQGRNRQRSNGSSAHEVEELKGGLSWAAQHGEGPLGATSTPAPVSQGKLSLLFPLSRTEVPAAKEALKKHRRETRQSCGKLGEEQAEHYPCWLSSRGGNLIVILVSSWDAALIPAFAISCQAQAPKLPLQALSKAGPRGENLPALIEGTDLYTAPFVCLAVHFGAPGKGL